MKKILSILSAFAIMISNLSFTAFAEEAAKTEKNWDYYASLSDEAVITEFESYKSSLGLNKQKTEFYEDYYGSFIKAADSRLKYGDIEMGVHIYFPKLIGEKFSKIKEKPSDYFGFPTEITFDDGRTIKYDFMDSDGRFYYEETNECLSFEVAVGIFRTYHLTTANENPNGADILRTFLTVYNSQFYKDFGKNGSMQFIELEKSSDMKIGDADLDAKITINDAIKVMSYVTNSSKYPICKAGIEAADIYDTGDGLNNMDALEIQKYLANIIN